MLQRRVAIEIKGPVGSVFLLYLPKKFFEQRGQGERKEYITGEAEERETRPGEGPPCARRRRPWGELGSVRLSLVRCCSWLVQWVKITLH
jgi:hypothetical protein